MGQCLKMASAMDKGAPRTFHSGKTEGPKAERAGWGSWEGAASPLPTSYGAWGVL